MIRQERFFVQLRQNPKGKFHQCHVEWRKQRGDWSVRSTLIKF